MSKAKKIIAIIQARMGSTRLPGKVLFNLEGETVLERVVERVNRSKFINEAIVATTMSREDLKIVKLCSLKGIRVYCGSEEDVLDRYFQVARVLKADHIVRVTADCPLLDPDVIDKAIRLHLEKRGDYTSNTIKVSFPDGQDVEVFKFDALKKAWNEARLSSEREHVTPYIWKNPQIFKLINLKNRKNLSQKRWTIDNSQDYKFIKTIYKGLYHKDKRFDMYDVLNFLNKHPEVEMINKGIIRNEGYAKSLREDREIKLFN